ncbi:transcriptional regulator (plasmid) [Azospirillum sp. B510]|uniref:DeoR/GlpR family DNA-binding transcription regulator n=1 Tax=Azospirillum sp. (strain B510) TaxID=137722 RepID=UPI0001C4BCE0|nr:DeoR/GlpR family DNA-binding transcription regulator [Azospirillum sp. B510]BAI74555.1 transcriptional regulator [Azospirillum sp. B510]
MMMNGNADDREHGLPQRQREILALIRDRGFVTIEALSEHFAVSDQTIRRDIIRLDGAGLLQRFHGGAGVRDQTVRLGYVEKQTIAPQDKERIGAAVAALVPDGASVFLDVGTTVEAVARALRGKRRLHVFTNSLSAGSLLAGRPGIDVFVTGGVVHGADGSLVGDAVIATLERCRLDLAVIGISGFDEDGAPMDFDMQKIGIKRVAMAAARRSVAVADAGKFARSAIVRIAPAGDFGLLVTDAEPPAPLGRAFERERLAVHVAGAEA